LTNFSRYGAELSLGLREDYTKPGKQTQQDASMICRLPFVPAEDAVKVLEVWNVYKEMTNGEQRPTILRRGNGIFQKTVIVHSSPGSSYMC
jgi:hypothetical protein